KPGGYADVSIGTAGQSNDIVVPASALIFRRKGMQVALLEPGGHVHLQAITIGLDLGQKVDVTEGLKPGDKVIDNPPDSLAEGQSVRLADNSHG
ncbi:MAG: efflux RND transporter periplasmic adaptor subunit, partial [Alphaproteobacteria bacterium]|nr:efflux RND transporter periplasmic adaptor subunit [Alphaproteobacteria bacterium]